MTRGELEKFEELFKMAFTEKIYNDMDARRLEKNVENISEVRVTAGCSVYILNLDLLDKALLKDLVLRYIECLKKKKAEAERAFEDIKVELPEGFVDKFGKPSNIPNYF